MNMIKSKKILRSFISYVPFIKKILRAKGTSPVIGEYYYKIFTSHISVLGEAGFPFKSGTIAEIGPGDTLGVGLCAILYGFNKYIGFDVIPHSNSDNNAIVLNELRKLFPIENKNFELLEKEIIKNASNKLKYVVPWNSEENIEESTIDLIISNAVMEHVVNLEDAYKIMFKWLKPGGCCSHVIDYRAHEFSDLWCEHFYINKYFWKFLMHGRMYPINRMPHSFHIKLLKAAGFEIILEKKNRGTKAELEKISKHIKSQFSEDDLTIQTAHIIARKPS